MHARAKERDSLRGCVRARERVFFVCACERERERRLPVEGVSAGSARPPGVPASSRRLIAKKLQLNFIAISNKLILFSYKVHTDHTDHTVEHNPFMESLLASRN